MLADHCACWVCEGIWPASWAFKHMEVKIFSHQMLQFAEWEIIPFSPSCCPVGFFFLSVWKHRCLENSPQRKKQTTNNNNKKTEVKLRLRNVISCFAYTIQFLYLRRNWISFHQKVQPFPKEKILNKIPLSSWILFWLRSFHRAY